jgi:hypothetical protein
VAGFIDTLSAACHLPPLLFGGNYMAKKQKIINIRVCFAGDRDASDVFAEVIAGKIRHTKTKDKLAKTTDIDYNEHEFSNLKSA